MFSFVTGKMSTYDMNTVKLLSFSPINQSKTKLNTNIPRDGKKLLIKVLKKNTINAINTTIGTLSTDRLMKTMPSGMQSKVRFIVFIVYLMKCI